MEAYAGVVLNIHSFLTWKPDGSEFLVYRIVRVTCVKMMAATIHLWIG
jgi:hypothetical protein